MTDDFAYADPHTLAGRVQRGRGLGASRALTDPAGPDVVYACVVTDTRWDRQSEQRDSYLARLIHRLDLPLTPIENHLFAAGGEGDAEEVELALHVLALLPIAGRFDAVPVLRRYATQGGHWSCALAAIEWTAARKIPELWAGLDADVVAAHDDADLAAHVDGGWEPWSTWAQTQPRIRRILDRHAAPRGTAPRRAPSARDLADTGSSVLVGRVAAVAGPERREALQELGRRGEPVLLDLAEDRSLRNPAGWVAGMPRALHHLGDAAVPRARVWTDSGDRTLNELALGVLSEFGDRDDGRCLLDALVSASATGAWCALETPARGLGRLRIAEAAQALVHAWETTVHSLARPAILQGLLGCAPESVEGYAVEALDDCEPGLQRQACAVAPDTVAVRARLRSLGDDPFASEAHDAARQRLSHFRGPGGAR